MKTPVFLIAARRSGTTLFRLMLNGHPQVAWHRGWETVADAIMKFESGTPCSQEVQLEGLAHFTAMSQDDLRAQLDREIQRLCREKNKGIFGATCHLGFKALPKLWNSAKIIHLIRDPRDVAISWTKLGWSGHFYFASDGWVEAERDWEALSTNLSNDQFIDVHYEELVTKPENELRRVCEFLEIEYTDQLFDYSNTSNYSYPKKDLAYRWRKQLSVEEVQLVESRIRPLMQARGYEPESAEKTYSGQRVALFRLRNTFTKRMKRIQEYGLSYVLADKLARSLNWKFLKNRVARARSAKRGQQIASLEKNY